MLKVSRIRFVAAIAAVVAAVGLAGHLDAVDQAQALGGASTATVREWDSWRAAHPDQAAAAFGWTDMPRCALGDGSADGGRQPVCKWDARVQGDRGGVSFVLVDGVRVVQWR